MRVVESSEAASEAERAAREDMERQAREWQTARDKLSEPDLQPALGALSPPASPTHELTYSGRDARSQVRARRRPAPPEPHTRSRGSVRIDLWSLEDARRRHAPTLTPAPSNTLDSWLATATTATVRHNK